VKIDHGSWIMFPSRSSSKKVLHFEPRPIKVLPKISMLRNETPL
jgi:hypothetical protein